MIARFAPLSTRLRLVLALFPFMFAAASAAQENFYLHNGDTVVFYGDSITDQRLYTTFVETFVLTRFPEMQVRFVHSGWGGDRVTGGGGGTIDERLERDVIAYRPTVMTVMLGMNDGGYRAFDEGLFKKYCAGYQHIVDIMKQRVPGLRMTLLQPSPFDDFTREPQFPGGYNSVLVRYGEFVKELAEKNGLAVADLNGPMVEVLRKAATVDSALAQRIIPDRVHPGPAGHLIMALSLLKAWRATPVVTAVEIDVPSAQVRRAVNTTVTGLTTGSSVSWTQKDKSLPMPVNMKDPVTAFAVRLSNFTDALNQQTLKVTGLSAKLYTLKINGTQVGSFTSEQFQNGLNLAEIETPMAKQAAEVHNLTMKRTAVHQMRWREVQMAFRNDNLLRVPSILDNLDALDADIGARQKAAAQPAATFYELIAQ